MKLISNLSGPFLIFLGAICLSFGGLIVKSFEGANLWQILFWRQIFFSITVALYLLFFYKKNFFKSFYNSGLPGFIGGLFLAIGFVAKRIKELLILNFLLWRLKKSFKVIVSPEQK